MIGRQMKRIDTFYLIVDADREADGANMGIPTMDLEATDYPVKFRALPLFVRREDAWKHELMEEHAAGLPEDREPGVLGMSPEELSCYLEETPSIAAVMLSSPLGEPFIWRDHFLTILAEMMPTANLNP
jgi:hypothetical protein